MSKALRETLGDIIGRSSELLHEVASCGVDFGFDQEQLAHQIEALLNELEASIEEAEESL